MTAMTLGEKIESSGCLRALKMSWADSTGWVEVEGGGAVTRRLVAARQIVQIELFESP